MRVIQDFKQAQQVLNQFISTQPGVRRYTLERMINLMDYIGNPQNNLKIIHVAGTSGKTSTSYYIASMLQKSGYKVGLTVSPHVDEVNERVQINLVPLPEKEFCKELGYFLNLVDDSGINPSYFEVLVAFAYWVFDKYKVGYAVIEVGLGGLLDGTNVINRKDKICVITDIGLDHTEVLGNTINEIALQKSGIIQRQNTVFIYDQSKVITDILRTKCQNEDADLYIITPDYFDNIELSALPLFQKRNFNLALKTVTYIINRDDNKTLETTAMQNALGTYVPARMEILAHNNKTLILDGSHNDQKIGALVDAIIQQFPKISITVMVSFGHNKQTSALASLKLLRKLGSTIIITRFDKGQDEYRTSIEPKELALHAREAGFMKIIVEPDPSLALKLLEKDKSEIGLITGSFYLLNHFRYIVNNKDKVQ